MRGPFKEDGSPLQLWQRLLKQAIKAHGLKEQALERSANDYLSTAKAEPVCEVAQGSKGLGSVQGWG